MNPEVPCRVVRVTSLAAFCAEIPPGPAGRRTVLRLLNRQTEAQHSAALLLSLQGLSPEGEIIWLCEVHSVSWLYGKPFGLSAESAWAGMRTLERIVRQRLEDLGYDIRTGDYGLPDTIRPLAAEFECARWCHVNLGEFEVQPTAPA